MIAIDLFAGLGGFSEGARQAGVPFFFKQWGEWHPHGQALADGSINYIGNPDIPGVWHSHGDGATMWRVGKKRAGALLDGREWREVPGA